MENEQIKYRRTLSAKDRGVLYIDELVETPKGLKERIYALKPSGCIRVDSDHWNAIHSGQEVMNYRMVLIDQIKLRYKEIMILRRLIIVISTILVKEINQRVFMRMVK